MNLNLREDHFALNICDRAALGWPRARFLFSCVAVFVVAISCVSWSALQPTPPKVANSIGFSAIRALDAARLVLGEEPRPVGSAANIAAVARLKDYFTSLGYAPQEQIATVKVPGRGEVTLRNIFIRRDCCGRDFICVVAWLATYAANSFKFR